MRKLLGAAAAVAAATMVVGTADARSLPTSILADTARLVSTGSPQGTLVDHTGKTVNAFSQNKQNEPSVAIDPVNPSLVAAGSNDEIDLELCNAGDPTTCPFTDGVGVSGIYFSTNGGSSWEQPTYTGYSARNCVGPEPCSPLAGGPIGTLPRYFESGLVSDGDPAVVWGPWYDPSLTTGFGLGGHFTWTKQRLYYANLTSNFKTSRAFRGAEAIYVSRLDSDRVGDAVAGVNTAWYAPVLVSRQNSALFSDKEQIWADNVQTSPFFGNVYICNVGFRSVGLGGAPEPVLFARSTDGGSSWTQRQLSAATNNQQTGGRQGCSIRTDSDGVVYVIWVGTDIHTRGDVFYMARSFDGGVNFERPRIVARITSCGRFDPATGRFSFDGIAGARTWSIPSLDIANGAPFGGTGTDELVLAWCNGPTPVAGSGGANEQALVQTSLDKGTTWTPPANAAPAGDRPDFPAIAISPSGSDAYLVYDNFLQPWQTTTASPRLMDGVVRHADIGGAGGIGAWSDLLRGVTGDARGSSQNGLTAEFLGDYNYAFATDAGATLVWNDVRNADSCAEINAYRQAFVEAVLAGTAQPMDEERGEDEDAPRGQQKKAQEQEPTPPAVNTDCLDDGAGRFGNSDIYGLSVTDPTP